MRGYELKFLMAGSYGCLRPGEARILICSEDARENI